MDPSDRRIRRSWWIFFGAFLLLSAIVLLDALSPDASFADLVDQPDAFEDLDVVVELLGGFAQCIGQLGA